MAAGEIRTVSRNGRNFQVVDLRPDGYDFWHTFNEWRWEQDAFNQLGTLLAPGDLLFDVGAWIGPYTLWAAALGIRVVAIEPDPVASANLQESVALNDFGSLVSVEACALALNGKAVALRAATLGDSCTSMTRENGLGQSLSARGISWAALVKKWGVPKAVKMDIEGGESLLLPTIGSKLRELDLPLLIALHPHWYAPQAVEAMEAELLLWDMQPLDNGNWFLRAKS